MNSQTNSPGKHVWAIDLDGTLMRSDAGFENALLVIRKNPLLIFHLVIWFLQGKMALKRELCKRAMIDASLLPYNEAVVKFVTEKRKEGKVYLVTASDHQIAEAVASHTKLFDGFFGTSTKNLSGKNKADFLDAQFGVGNWSYAGNAPVDFNVWERSKEVFAVSPSGSFIDRVRSRFPNATALVDTEAQLSSKLLIRQLRIYQWMKNTLLFVPLILSHEISIENFLLVVGAFVAFGMAASSVYLLNDLLDLEADRAHARKRSRPLASGRFPIPLALGLSGFGFIFSVVGAFFISPQFASVLLAYIICSNLYSTILKKVHTVDILTLAGLYTLRIIAGGVAAGLAVPASPWLLAFSMFFFLSLACVKRATEIAAKAQSGVAGPAISGRGYTIADHDLVKQLGVSCAGLSSLVLALYVSGPDVQNLYSCPEFLWLTCPVVLFWMIRVWAVTLRGEMHDDPLVYAFKDKASYIVAAMLGVLLVLAI